MRHGKAIAKCQAWEMYKECASGTIDPEWKLDSPLSSPNFRSKLDKQMCGYRSARNKYPGDKYLRRNTRLTQQLKIRRDASLGMSSDGTKHVSYNQYLDAKHPRMDVSRLYSDNIDLLKEHLNSIKKVHKSKCQVCKEWCCTKCVKCDAHMCFKSKPHMSSISCCLDYHNDDHFGLIRDHCKELFGDQPSAFTTALKCRLWAHKHVMAALRKKYGLEYGENL